MEKLNAASQEIIERSKGKRFDTHAHIPYFRAPEKRDMKGF
jgi:hypothetical protein